MTGWTEPQLSSQNIAGFSNISDFPSNCYKHKLYRQIINLLTTSLAIAQFVCTGSVPRLICSSFYTHHVFFAFRKPLLRRQTHSMKSISSHISFRCVNTCGIRYIDISASDKTFRLFVAVRKCSVAPAGNKFSNNISCLILQNIVYEFLRVLLNCPPYLCNCILGGQRQRQIRFFSAMKAQRGEEVWLHSFINTALYGGE
jgi:hypothetical protein